MLQSRQIGLSLVKAQFPQRVLMDRRGNKILEVEFPADGKLRARKVVTRSRARATGKYPSWKMERMVEWESQNELNAFRLLDATPAVQAFHEQPLALKYLLNGKAHRHYPDVLVEWGHSRELWEVKTASDAGRPEFLERTRVLQALLPELGFSYKLVVAEELSKQPRLDNVLLLLKYGRSPVDAIHRERLRLVMAEAGSVAWQSALDGSFGPSGRELLARLVLEGVLVADLDTPIGPASFFRKTPIGGASA